MIDDDVDVRMYYSDDDKVSDDDYDDLRQAQRKIMMIVPKVNSLYL